MTERPADNNINGNRWVLKENSPPVEVENVEAIDDNGRDFCEKAIMAGLLGTFIVGPATSMLFDQKVGRAVTLSGVLIFGIGIAAFIAGQIRKNK